MEKHQLSKSTFIRGIQCLKSLYLYKNRYFLRDRLSPEQLAKFKRGTDVGVFAQTLFPGGIDCKPKSPSQYSKSIAKTAEIIASQSADVIYEAAVQFDRVLILLDILAKENGKWNAYEVKSSLKISETYLHDAALQYYVLTNSGIEINKFFLVHINPEYAYSCELNIHELFSFADVTQVAIQKQDFIKQQIEAAKEAIQLKNSPAIDIGAHCNFPYPCDFIGHCWKHVPGKSIFNLTQWSDEQKFEFYAKGILKLEDLSPEHATSPSQKNELDCHIEGKDFFDNAGFADFIKPKTPTVCFAGFLSHRIAIPLWEKYKPFDLVPVSMSVKSAENTEILSFCNENSESDPDLNFLHFLKDALPDGNSLMMFDSSRFRELLSRMAFRNAGNADFLEDLITRIIDLKTVFDDFLYFNPIIGNDFSIHNVSKKLMGQTPETTLPFASDTLAVNTFLKMSTPEKEPGDCELLNNYTAKQTRLISDFYQFFTSKLI